MPEIIKNGQIVDDAWQVLRLKTDQPPESIELPPDAALFPVSVWKTRKPELLARLETTGVWLASHETPEDIAEDIAKFRIIGIDFPKFSDGRGYSSARLLRERFRFKGEIRAIGDVLRDQLFLMKRCGIDAYAIRPGKDVHAALAGLRGFSETYQGDVDQPRPLFLRRYA
ncbi:MAG: DUF934 domain-containing protein [Candidatus Accumulibacter sp.]|jgi:uncharacterized protein (DUF934 family)|nr:DUF934 domain-containing protein [Accumulibacter sp.]